jgi:cupin-like protein
MAPRVRPNSASAALAGNSRRMRPRPLKQVKRLSGIGLKEFARDYLTPRKPVVFTDLGKNWEALKLWSFEYLYSIVGNIEVPVYKSSTMVFRPETQYGFDRVRTTMPFRDYLEALKSGGARAGYCYYLATVPFTKQYPVLASQIDCSHFFRESEELELNAWISATGTVTPLHADPFDKHNFHVVITGEKRFVIYAPKDRENLAPYSSEERIQQFSRIDIDNPDLQQFPDFPKAQGWECYLRPGDLLFLPMWWWHQVYTLKPAISVNVWWPESALK